MSDRASLSVTIFACPPEHQQAVAALVADAQMVEGATHVWEEKVLGCEATYAEALTAISPQIAYQVTQDAKYEYDGATVLSVPGMGTYTADVSASGRVILACEEIVAAITAAGAASPAVLAAVDAAYGRPHFRALAALESPAEHDRPASA